MAFQETERKVPGMIEVVESSVFASLYIKNEKAAGPRKESKNDRSESLERSLALPERFQSQPVDS